jgi:hypothetical protein
LAVLLRHKIAPTAVQDRNAANAVENARSASYIAAGSAGRCDTGPAEDGMIFHARRTGWIAGVALAMMGALSTALLAGGSGFDDDEHEHDDNAGPAFFGFVKDTRGGVVPGATVRVAIKGVAESVTKSNILGAYRVPGFRADIDTKLVLVVCERQGYKYVRSFRRTAEGASKQTPIETECVLQKG